VKITGGIEVVINNASSFVDLFMATSTESICRKSTRLKFSEIQEKQPCQWKNFILASIIKQYMGNKIG
jgi:hypothetical protein